MRRIVCIGNPDAAGDGAGAAVLARLAAGPLPAGVELVDGGIRGLDLLGLVESSERVAFVDAVSGWGAPGAVVLLDADDLARAPVPRYGHATGFAYLLRSLPALLQPPVPVRLVGLEPPAGPAEVERAAGLALAFVGAEG